MHGITCIAFSNLVENLCNKDVLNLPPFVKKPLALTSNWLSVILNRCAWIVNSLVPQVLITELRPRKWNVCPNIAFASCRPPKRRVPLGPVNVVDELIVYDHKNCHIRQLWYWVIVTSGAPRGVSTSMYSSPLTPKITNFFQYSRPLLSRFCMWSQKNLVKTS